MRRGGNLIFSLALCCAALLALPALAGARVAYFTGFGEEGPYAAPVDLAGGAEGAPTILGGESSPDVAISPDGSTAYVTGAEGGLTPIDVATNEARPTIPTASFETRAIAIAPDGSRAYAASPFENSVSVFDLASGAEVGAPIPVGEFPAGIAITPDGSRAYVSDQNEDKVSVLDLATNTVATISVGSEPTGIAVTPDGAQVYVVDQLGESVSVIEVATDAVVTTIPTPGVKGEDVAISPDGTHAYVLSFKEGVVPIDLATGVAGSPIPLAEFNGDIAIAPDGSRAYITRQPPQSVTGELLPLELATNTFAARFEIGEEPQALAIVPNQPPHASFTHSPDPASPGSAVSFDASGSTDSDGTVARYDWDFGDGSSAADAGAKPQHAYAKAGSYQVTVTETDNEGCSTSIVFTGQTAYCNGSSVARATGTVTVAAPAVTPPAPCPTVRPHATSFKPRIRPGHVVPGVRVRLATPAPALLKVHATLLWRWHHRAKRTHLRTLAVGVHRWRRVRFPIPARLRQFIPLGRKVRVRLRIVATPRGRNTCRPAAIVKVLHVRVVKVFPNAVQASSLR